MESQPVSAPSAATSAALEGPIPLLKSAWAFFRSNWKILVTLLLIPHAISAVGQFIIQSHMGALSVLGVILAIAGFILSIPALVGTIDAIHVLNAAPGSAMTWQSQYRVGWKRFWSFILMAIIVALSSLGATALFLIPGIMLMVYGCLYLFTFVLDGKKGFSALTESFSLVRGRWWPVLGRIIVLVIVVFLASIILGFIGGLLGGSAGLAAGARVSAGALVVSLLINLVINSIFTPLALVYMYRLYVNLKATRLPDSDSASTFKGWLIAFLCVGAVSLVLLVTVVPLMVITAVKTTGLNPSEFRAKLESNMSADELRQLQESFNSTGESVIVQ